MTHTRQPIRTEWTIANPAAAAEAIADTVDRLRAMEDELTLLVGLMREGGVAWGPIGEALGMTRQGAQRAYRGATDRVDQLHADAEQHEDAEREMVRLRRKLSLRVVRIVHEVRATADGGTLSRHFVLERAEEMCRRAGEGHEVVTVELRSKVRAGLGRCRVCQEDVCACSHDEQVYEAEQDAAGESFLTGRRWEVLDEDAEPSF